MYSCFVKRFIDFFGALLLVVVFSPVFFFVTLLLFFANRGSVFFSQLRPGKNEKIFKIYKFKTMNDLKDKDGALLPDNQRLTAVGKWVRKLSLDELPQLLNILKGEMSFIGPRPLIVEYLPIYSEIQKKRHNIRPGISGWAQVNGRNSISWKKKFELDVWYVENYNFLVDLKIAFLTVKKVLKSENVNLNDTTTAEYFNGSN